MNIGVISDIHGNYPALKTVVDSLDTRGVDEIVCVGDIVGILGASEACASLVRDKCTYVVYGNHDARFFPDRNWVPVRDVDIAEYEQVMDDLSNNNYEWLTSLPATTTAYGDVTIVHARPGTDDPAGTTRENAGVFPRDFIDVGGDYLDGGILLVGHTHEQHAVDLGKFDGQSGLMLNPGSVGFPFDKDAKTRQRFDRVVEDTNSNPTGKASYATVDTDTREYGLHTVEYDAEAIQTHVDKWGL